MAAITLSLAPTNNTDANFRLWGKAISDAIIAGGWILQETNINWTTVTAPTAVSTVKGYEIFRSNDGTNQVYLKIEYGSGSGSASNPANSFQVGWGSDGSGNLTGFTSTKATSFLSPNNSSTTPANCNLHASSGSIAIAMWNAGGQAAFVFSLERTRDALSAKQDEVFMYYYNANNTSHFQVINRTTGAYAVETGTNGKLIVNNTNASVGGNLGVSMMFGQKGGFINPSQNIYGSTTALIGSAQTTVNIDSYGETHTYIVNSPSSTPFSSGVAHLTRFD